MELLKECPDNYYQLCIVDPPYGIGNIIRHGKGGQQLADNMQFEDSGDMYWNKKIPEPEYFQELCRVSKNQIIWGGNYYANFLNNSKCWIVWDKENGGNSFSDSELAWTSFDKPVRNFKFRWAGMLQGNMKNKEQRIHPTQKPVALYKWLLTNYAKEGYKILDTHGGSMSIAIACHDLKFDLDLFELDEDYYKAGKERFENYAMQEQFNF